MSLPPPIPLLTLVAAGDDRPLLASVIGADYSALALTPQHGNLAPDVVRSALPRFGTWDAATRTDLSAWLIQDFGNAHATEAAHFDEAWGRMHGLALQAHGAGRPVVGFGGDHSVLWPLATAARDALAERSPSGHRIGLVQFDVHHDVRPIDVGPSNGTPVRGLVERGVIDPRDIVQVGIHPMGNRRELTEWCDANSVDRLMLDDVARLGVTGVLEHIERHLEHCDAIYVTVDIDVLDRAFAPGTAAALPGGLSPATLAALVYGCCTDVRLIGVDTVEFDPTRDVAGVTAYAVANVVMHALSGMAHSASPIPSSRQAT